MTNEIRKQIDGLEVFWTGEIKATEGLPSRYVLLSDVVDILTKLADEMESIKSENKQLVIDYSRLLMS